MYTHPKERGCPRGVMVKAMDCGIVVREFVLQSRYYVHARARVCIYLLLSLNTHVYTYLMLTWNKYIYIYIERERERARERERGGGRLGSDDNEGILCITQNYCITRTSPSDCLVLHQGHSWKEVLPLCREAVGVFSNHSRLGKSSGCM